VDARPTGRLPTGLPEPDYRAGGITTDAFDEIMDAGVDDDDAIQWVKENDWFADNYDRGVTAVRVKKLLDHLMRSGHWGPFEHPQATVAIENVSRVLMAQLTRHRHFTFDVMSLRYVDVDGDPRDICHVPHADDLEISRDGTHDVLPQTIQQKMAESYQRSIVDYRDLIDTGVPPEEARKVLPMGTKVNVVMSGNARAWMHILNVRTKADVQGETRRCANAIFDELQNWMEYTFSAYDDMLPMELGP